MHFKKCFYITVLLALISFGGSSSNAGDDLQSKANDHLVTKQSPYSVAVTLDRLTSILTAKGLTIFARIDHSAGAANVGLEMLPTQLLIFGNPKTGTPLMQSNRTVGFDLPLKALAWRDKAGQVWLAYTSPKALKQRYHIEDQDGIFAKITGALDKITDAALKGD